MEDGAGSIRSLSICAVGGAGLVWACCRRGNPGRALSHGVSSHGGRMLRGRAVVYADKGAGQRSVATLVATLREHGLTVRTILANEVVAGGWEYECDLFAMPGGADQPYCALLNGQGNARIRSFVAGGGSYIGICAGAYYGSARCEFELGTELEIAGARELAFFPGIARGAAFPGFVYANETGSRAAELLLPWKENERAASPTFRDAPAPPRTCTVSLRIKSRQELSGGSSRLLCYLQAPLLVCARRRMSTVAVASLPRMAARRTTCPAATCWPGLRIRRLLSALVNLARQHVSITFRSRVISKPAKRSAGLLQLSIFSL
jgi:putative intracellular protease/amidase